MDKIKTYYEQEVDRISGEKGLSAYHYIQVRQSKRFMERNLSGKIELEEMASSACMSRFHYIRIFQQVYGVTPRQFLKALRIERAKELLIVGMPVAQVCDEIGYESIPTFSLAFRRGTGASPKLYQAQNKSNRE